MNNSPRLRGFVALFLFVSGFCSLAYQVVWLREFRLVFGGSTAAASAVLAVFMGALGVGGWFLGKRVDLSKRPGRMYAVIEGIIGFSVLLSPLILILGKNVYGMTGGFQSLGSLAVLVQMVITVFVLGVPCFFMGGTLPAAISMVQDDDDEDRQSTAFLYGINIAGAVSGAFLVNFYSLEIFGNTLTLLMAGVLNVLLAMVAYGIGALREKPRPLVLEESSNIAFSGKLLYGLAFFSGLLFFIIEIIWFRTSIPLLGGSVYNFGLILVIALAGMSFGGGAYSILLKYTRPSYALLAFVSGMLALALALPYIFGDEFARFCMVLQSGYIEYPFGSKLWIWFVIGGLLVFPTAFMAGVQFPLILSLIGKGNVAVGKQIGRVYGFNTAGAVIGSILGGFVLIPQLTISYSWMLLIAVALLMSLIVLLYSFYQREKRCGYGVVCLAVFGLVGGATYQSAGITPYWSQNPIGFGRASITPKQDRIKVEEEIRALKRRMVYQFDGRELSGALSADMDLGLLSNGKSDGSALLDAGTQVMLTLLGAALHPAEVKTACVIGLGTGSSAGWLAQVPSVESVDVFELEPHLLDCARYFSPVNQNVLDNPKVRVIIGDAREGLVVSNGKKYDLIASEPSNPQRAGVANLYTREFYESISSRLEDEGVFTQWLQAYEIDVESIRLILTTLNTVFPKVEVFQTLSGDLVFVCAKNEKPWDLEKVRKKVGGFPFAMGARYTWGVSSAEGYFAHCVANAKQVKIWAQEYPYVNTDDLNILEFDLGKTGGSRVAVDPIPALYAEASENGMVLSEIEGTLDRKRFAYDMASLLMPLRLDVEVWKKANWFDVELAKKRYDFQTLMLTDPQKALNDTTFKASNTIEESLWCRALVQEGDSRALASCEKFKDTWPLDYHAMRIRYFNKIEDQGKEDEEIMALLRAFQGNVWCRHTYLNQTLSQIVLDLDGQENRFKSQAAEALKLLDKPFGAHMFNLFRLKLRWALAEKKGGRALLKVVLDLEPYFPFIENMLQKRLEVYRSVNHPNIKRAEDDLKFFNTL